LVTNLQTVGIIHADFQTLMKNLNDTLASFLREVQSKTLEAKEKSPLNGDETTFSSAFLTELVHRIKSTVASVKQFILISQDKFDDKEFWKQSLSRVTEDIGKTDSVLNSLLNYISINSPIVKSDTLYFILEGILEANEKQINGKKIKILKRLEKNLPETSMHDEQVRFVLNSILQYAILSAPLDGTIGFLVKPLDSQKGDPGKKTSPENNGGFIGVSVGFMHNKNSDKPSGGMSGTLNHEREEALNLILELVKEIIQKNRGTMSFQSDKKKPRTLITLKLPIERRKLIYYEPISI